MNVTLIQIRHPDDAMAAHEQACLDRRVEGLQVDWSVRNVFEEQPSASWLKDASAMIIGGSGSYSVHDARSTNWVTPLRDVLELALETPFEGHHAIEMIYRGIVGNVAGRLNAVLGREVEDSRCKSTTAVQALFGDL